MLGSGEELLSDPAREMELPNSASSDAVMLKLHRLSILRQR